MIQLFFILQNKAGAVRYGKTGHETEQSFAPPLRRRSLRMLLQGVECAMGEDSETRTAEEVYRGKKKNRTGDGVLKRRQEERAKKKRKDGRRKRTYKEGSIT